MTETFTYRSNVLMAYVDILGFTKKVRGAPLPSLVSMLNEFIGLDNSNDYIKLKTIRTKFVSDSLIVWIELSEPKDVTSFFVYIGSLVANIHKKGSMFVRGCIGYGDHYSDEKMWISPVFIDVYEGEREAKFPRIVLLRSAETAVEVMSPGFMTGMWFERDESGVTFMNYMNLISGAYQPSGDHIVALLNHSELIPSLINHRDSISKCLRAFPEQVEKYMWLAKLHNSYVGKHINLPDKHQYLVAAMS